MSQVGARIFCDGEECEEVAALPIALNPEKGSARPWAPSPAGWLFVQGSGDARHFCPDCAVKRIQEEE